MENTIMVSIDVISKELAEDKVPDILEENETETHEKLIEDYITPVLRFSVSRSTANFQNK